MVCHELCCTRTRNDRYMSSEQRDFRKLKILHETETVGKQRSDDSDEQLEDQFSQECLSRLLLKFLKIFRDSHATAR